MSWRRSTWAISQHACSMRLDLRVVILLTALQTALHGGPPKRLHERHDLTTPISTASRTLARKSQFTARFGPMFFLQA